MIKLFILLAFATTSTNCIKRTGVNDPSRSKNYLTASIFQSPFRKVPNSPNLSAGSDGQPTFLSDPAVIRDESGLHLFVLNSFCDYDSDGTFQDEDHLFSPSKTLACQIAGRGKGAILYAFSEDEGKSWQIRPTPIITNGINTWDSFNIETPFAFVHAGKLHIFYCATGLRNGSLFEQRFQIGYATLDLNGRTLKEALLNDLSTAKKWKGGHEPFLPYRVDAQVLTNNIQEPSVIVKADGFELYFTGLELLKPDLDLSEESGNNITSMGLVRQKFDFNWTPVGPLEISSPTLWQVASAGRALVPANIADVHFFRNEYHVFYTTNELGAEFHQGERLAYARSSNGLDWTDQQLIATPSLAGNDFDDWGIMAPTVVFDKDKALMFYTAWGQTKNRKCLLHGSGSRWGKGVMADTKCVYSHLARAEAKLIQ